VDESVTNIIKQDQNQINRHPHLEYLVHEYPQPFLPIKPATKKEIYDRSLKWKNSCGYDEVPTKIVQRQSGVGEGFLRVLRFPLPKAFVPPTSPSTQSPGAVSRGLVMS
jgi:hypothetical protein